LASLSIENVEILGDPEQPIVNVLPPTVVKEPIVVEEGIVEEEIEEGEEKPAEQADEAS